MDAEDSGVTDLNKLLTCEYTQMCMRMAEAACIQVHVHECSCTCTYIT